MLDRTGGGVRGGGCYRRGQGLRVWSLGSTYSLHCSSFWGLPYRILIIYLVKPKKELEWRLEVGLCCTCCRSGAESARTCGLGLRLSWFQAWQGSVPGPSLYPQIGVYGPK